MKCISDKKTFLRRSSSIFFAFRQLLVFQFRFCIQFVQREAKFAIVVNALDEILYRVREHISGRCRIVSGLIYPCESSFNVSIRFRDNHWPTCHFSFNFVGGFSDFAFNYLPSESRTSLWFVIDLIEIWKCATRKQDVFRVVFDDTLSWEYLSVQYLVCNEP